VSATSTGEVVIFSSGVVDEPCIPGWSFFGCGLLREDGPGSSRSTELVSKMGELGGRSSSSVSMNKGGDCRVVPCGVGDRVVEANDMERFIRRGEAECFFGGSCTPETLPVYSDWNAVTLGNASVIELKDSGGDGGQIPPAIPSLLPLLNLGGDGKL